MKKKLILGVALLATALLLVVALQNTESTTVRLFAWEFTMSRFVLLLLAAAGGFVGGFTTGQFVSVIPRRKPPE